MSFLELCGIVFIGILVINIVVGIWAIKTSTSIADDDLELSIPAKEQDLPAK
jgi:hypothetical protein